MFADACLLAAAFAEGNSAVKATANEQARYSSGTPRTCYRSTGRASTFSPGFPELRAIEARLASQELDLQNLCGKNVAEMLPNVAGKKKCSRKRVQLLPGKNVAELKESYENCGRTTFLPEKCCRKCSR